MTAPAKARAHQRQHKRHRLGSLATVGAHVVDTLLMLPTGIDALDARLIRAMRDPRAGHGAGAPARGGEGDGTGPARQVYQRGVICGFDPDLDLRHGLRGAGVRQPRDRPGAARGRLLAPAAQIPEVLEIYSVTGLGDLNCRVVAHTNEHLQDVIGRVLEVQGISRTTTQIALTEQLRHRALPLVELAIDADEAGALLPTPPPADPGDATPSKAEPRTAPPSVGSPDRYTGRIRASPTSSNSSHSSALGSRTHRRTEPGGPSGPAGPARRRHRCRRGHPGHVAHHARRPAAVEQPHPADERMLAAPMRPSTTTTSVPGCLGAGSRPCPRATRAVLPTHDLLRRLFATTTVGAAELIARRLRLQPDAVFAHRSGANPCRRVFSVTTRGSRNCSR